MPRTLSLRTKDEAEAQRQFHALLENSGILAEAARRKEPQLLPSLPEPPRRKRTYYLYALGCEGTNYVKIGHCTYHVSHRLKALQTGCPFALSVVAEMEFDTSAAATKAEQICHKELAEYRHRGEWFDCDRDLLLALLELVSRSP